MMSSMDMEYITILKEWDMKVAGKTKWSMDKEYKYGQMVENIKVSGMNISCMVMDALLGQMVANTLANIIKVERMDTVFIKETMEVVIKAISSKTNIMVMEN